MAIDRTDPRPAPLWGGRLLEWGILAIVIVGLMFAFGHYARSVQGQSERASVQSTLGALRTGLVFDQMQRVAGHGEPLAGTSNRNPFDVLEHRPANYSGTVSNRNIEGTAPGSWVYDAQCGCVGYKPLNPEWVESPPHTQALWYQLTTKAGPQQLVPLAIYQWQGQPVN